jgi:hypothetical protein
MKKVFIGLFVLALLSLSVLGQTQYRDIKTSAIKFDGESDLENFEQILAKVQEQTMEQIRSMNQLRIEQVCEKDACLANEFRIRTLEKAKLFGIIPTDIDQSYILNSEGQLSREKQWYDFMYKYNGG